MKPHPTDLVSLGFGAVFLGLAGVWLAMSFVRVSWPFLAALVAVGLIVVGVAGAVKVASGIRQQDPPQ